MRKDMGKVLTEKYRRGGRLKDVKGRKRTEDRIPYEDQPIGKERGNLCRKWISNWSNHKEFDINLSPLCGFVLSRVGRKWDDVYSEICRAMNKNSIVQAHIFQYLCNYVAIEVYLKNGIPYEFHQRKYRCGMQVYQETYVDPTTGILCKTPTTKKRYRCKTVRPDPSKYAKGPGPMVCYAKDTTYSSGIWYECFLKDKTLVKEPVYLRNRLYRWNLIPVRTEFDMFLCKNSTTDNESLRAYGLASVFCYKKRQLNKREIRKITQRA